MLALVVGFAAVAAVAGGVLVARQRAELRRGALDYVTAVTDFRAAQLGRWLAERRADAQVAGRDGVLASLVASGPNATMAMRASARRRLETIARSYRYQALALLDADGREILAVGPPIDRHAPELASLVAAAPEAARTPLSQLTVTGDGNPTLELVMPLHFDLRTPPTLVGTLVLRIDTGAILLELLGAMPSSYRTGELTLTDRAREPALVFRPKARLLGQPWVFALPSLPPRAPERIAEAGEPLGAGLDEVGRPLLTARSPVTGAAWTVVGTMADGELVDVAVRALWLTVGLVAAVLLALALLARSVWLRRAELDLRASEEKFRNIFDNMQDGYILSTMPGEIMMVNPAAVRMLGYTDAQELLGKRMAEDVFENPADRLALQARLRKQGVVRGHKATFKRADGSPLIVEGHVRLVHDESGVPFAVEGVVRDMSVHYAAREELISAREAALAAAEAKAQFLANMSHEIRTPLNAIVGLGHLLARAELPPALADHVGNLQTSAHMLLDVVNNVLDFSKMEAGRLELEEIPFDLPELLAAVVRLFELPARDRGLALRCELPPEVPRTVCGDPVRLRQVLTNLVGNGIKFTERGQVVLAVARQPGEPGRARLELSVSDTGIGIATDRAARVFQPFVQADGSTTRQFGGTGLGLAISHRLVQLMGGELHMQSTPGQGSRFSFTLDLALDGPRAAGAPPAPRPDALAGQHILVVEDNSINQQVARELLEGAGARVTVAGSGRAAVDAVMSPDARFAAVLMDVQMPQMDGFEATRLIRAEPRHAALPIIAMTAHTLEPERRKCLAAGMNDHVGKPVEPAALFATLARWVTSAAPSEPEATAPVLDQPAGLRRVAGNQSLYRRLLRRFADDWGDGGAQVRGLTGDDRQAARRAAHTLKGAGGTLGLVPLAGVAATLEERLATGADPGDALPRTLAALADARAAIADALADAPAAAPPAAAGPVDETLAQLEGLLHRRNLRAREAAARLLATPLPERCQARVAEVVGNVDRLDYAAAEAALRALRAALAEPNPELRA